MHVGYESAFANPGRPISDAEAYKRDLRLFDLAEPLGFESIWTTEHHFTDYNMTPNAIQFLTYMAGRTKHALLGTGVVVLPWHDPVRVAEQMILLDHFSGGRALFGIGRGAAAQEFEGFRVEMSDSRERFLESAELILNALETGTAEFSGDLVVQPSKELRPAPFATYRGRSYVGSMSPESFPAVVRLGLGLKIVVQKKWDVLAEEVRQYDELFRAHHGYAPPKPIATVLAFVDENEDRAKEIGHKWLSAYFNTTVDHYGFNKKYEGPGEFYRKMGERFASAGSDEMANNFVKLCPHGTPEQVFTHIERMHSQLGIGGVVVQFLYAGMDEAEGERNMRLFASDVMPGLKHLSGGLGLDVEAASVLQ